MAKVREKDVQKELKESAHKIWLAGLGAFAVAEEEGGKLFKSLIKKGEEFEKESRAEFGKVKQTVEKAREKAGDAWDQLGETIDKRIGATLKRLDVPSKQEIAKLSERIEELTGLVGEASPFGAFVDPDCPDFMNPPSMVEAIRSFCLSKLDSVHRRPWVRVPSTRCFRLSQHQDLEGFCAPYCIWRLHRC